jgi:hypothetical protein
MGRADIIETAESDAVAVGTEAVVTTELSGASDILLIETARPGARGELDAGAVEWTTMRADVDALLARPAISGLGSIPDVDTTGVADGDTLVYDSAANGGLGGYVAAAPSGAIGAVDGIADVTTLTTGAGLTSSEVGAGTAELAVAFGGTGTAAAASRADHTHTVPSLTTVPYAASGALSSGARLLAQANPTLLAGVTYLVVARLRSTQRGGGGASAYYRLFLNIWNGTESVVRTSQVRQSVGYVPDPRDFDHGAVVAGSGTAYPVSASIIYESGDPVLVDAGELVVELHPAR